MNEFLSPGFGQRLAQAREAKGLSHADVAAKLKLTARQIEAMELEDMAHLPGEIFVRGFVRNYARLVDLDAAELLAPVDAGLAVSETITAHSEGLVLSSGGLKRWLLWPLIAGSVFVVLVAVLYQWLSQGEEALVLETAPLPAASAPAAAVPADGVPVDPALTAPSTAPVSPTQAPTPAPTQAPAGAAPVAPPAAVVVPEPVVAPKAQADGKHVLRFTAAHDAWVQVVDGEGKRFSRLVQAGSSESLAGKAPFRLVVGEAARVTLSYDGHAIDLTPYIGEKVARLTLE